jgi:signal transduction histidine kinase
MVEQAAILLIEDEERLCKNLQTLLQFEGYRVTTAENGREGIEKLREELFDLVITDVVMPEMDGFQIMDYLKEHCPDTVVVAITAYVSTDSAIDALRRGAYDYLAKPFEFDLMHLVIKRALEKARMQNAFRHHMRGLERQVAERTRALTEANQYLQRSLADLRAAQEQLVLTEKIRTLGELTAVVAHELREPLSIIAGFTQVMTEMAPPRSMMRTKLEEVTQAASRCQQIVNSLFNFTWRQPPHKVYTDIDSLCEKALESLTFRVDLSLIHIEKCFDASLPKTMADPQQLQLAFFNIALNAYQAMISYQGTGKLILETRRGEGVILIAFHDDGPGISQEHLGCIFDPFFTTKPGGTGLGLSVAYGIIEVHEGKLVVQSTPGEGTTFLIQLPLTGGVFRSDDTGLGEAHSLGRKRVLVIESDEKNLGLLQEVIRHLGHEVEGVYSAQELLERVVRQSYDLLIAQADLPQMDGQTLYQRVNALRPELAQRTIFIADDALSENASRFLAQVDCPLLRKPFGIADIEMTMRRALES